MEEDIEQKNVSNKVLHKTVHHVLAHSYLVFFLFFIFGLVLDLIIPVKIFQRGVAESTGFLILILATMIIVWAQLTSSRLEEKEITKESFCKGPYCYTRTPTHWGLFLLVIAFGLIMNAFFIITTTLVSFLLTKFFFLKKEEMMLEKKYGQPYLEYKKMVKF